MADFNKQNSNVLELVAKNFVALDVVDCVDVPCERCDALLAKAVRFRGPDGDDVFVGRWCARHVLRAIAERLGMLNGLWVVGGVVTAKRLATFHRAVRSRAHDVHGTRARLYLVRLAVQRAVTGQR